MMKRRTSCAALVLILLALGAYAYLRPAALPAEAQASVDAYVQRCQGHTFDYRIVSAEKAARTIAGNVEDVVFFSGQVKWPSGIHAPNSPGVQDNWCVILDRPVGTPAGSQATHLLVQKRETIWFVEGVPDSAASVFGHFGCGRW
jgi:hypothetical protein